MLPMILDWVVFGLFSAVLPKRVSVAWTTLNLQASCWGVLGSQGFQGPGFRSLGLPGLPEADSRSQIFWGTKRAIDY